MIEESKRIEYWNYLTLEKNQPRPRGITVQRLAVVKSELLKRVDLWNRVIENYGALSIPAADFYESGDASALRSRADFWEAVRGIIVREESRRSNRTEPAISNSQSDPKNNRKNPAEKNRRFRTKR